MAGLQILGQKDALEKATSVDFTEKKRIFVLLRIRVRA